MNVIVYYPQTEEGMDALRKKVAEAYAMAVSERISRLNMPKEKKLELIDKIIENVHNAKN